MSETELAFKSRRPSSYEVTLRNGESVTFTDAQLFAAVPELQAEGFTATRARVAAMNYVQLHVAYTTINPNTQ